MDTWDKIHLTDLHVRGILGLNDWEREKRQDILVSLTLYTDVRAAGRSDDPSDIINYRSVAKDIIDYVESSEHFLVEALATEIARICVVVHGASRVRVRVDKPGAIRFARTVGVEIERDADDFS